ncbi:hypothetical protein [uncultured Methanoregula sp.]|uniref:hypothetical protein n=1 Tax=uncultured Methanoregula sp. TaxID=1005933 RepID=UPI002AAAA70C|nr:hypothetical protein [uncultured Methanoregula sp.]
MEKPVTLPQIFPAGSVRLIAGIFWMILAAAVMLTLLILLLPQQIFLAISNYLQILTALGGAAAIGFLHFRYGHRSVLPYAAGAFALWGISNIAWYVNVALGLRAQVFPGLIDMGIIASILVLMVAYQNGLKRKPCSRQLLTGLLVLFLIIPVGILFTSGFTGTTLVTFLYFFACGSLIITALSRGLTERPFLLAGTVLFAVAFMIYPVREMFFSTNSLLSVIGTFVVAGLALMVLGFIGLSMETLDAGPRSG